ncbi:C-type lectin domain family 14 member A [Stegastes partitus]|uniref:C-type lectin domain family 14 member A n=1 Tax=Stegastes partitus TaxID=144197 RepID=A0A9Y4NCF1_9TELE|nr:PREDICTED: C-type lectin domain family 14 member A [Stegastes partitus]
MACRLFGCWTPLCIVLFLLSSISADPSLTPRYVLHSTRGTFDDAMQRCSPGVLTTLATNQEVDDILKLVSNSVPLQDDFTFWLGLRKAKNECVVPAQPLRGFRWTADGSEESQVSRWAEEPVLTCTGVRCAALKGQFDGSTTSWGLIPVKCKNEYPFICKLKGGLTEGSPEGEQATVNPEPEPVTTEPKPAATEPSKPATPKTRPATSEHVPTTPEPELPTEEPEPELVPGPGPDPMSDACLHPIIPGTRSLSLDPDNSSRVQVECWSTVRLDLFCSGRPALWRTLDGSPANFSTVCLQCSHGFHKDAAGRCMDVDECADPTRTPCKHTCLNTEGSYRCVCSDADGKQHDEGSLTCQDLVMVEDGGALSGILVPVLIAVAALVVLVVVVAVTVKCCLMRRSKKRAIKAAEKMAMKSKQQKDAFQTANEKTAT